MSSPQTLADDLIIGADKIAAHTGHKPRQIYNLHETAQIPTFKIGNAICARKSELSESFSAKKRSA